MTVIAFIGKPRTGKTLFMTWHAYMNYLKGHRIFSNYKLSFPHTIMSPYQMLAIPFEKVDRDNKSLCIQEAGKWFPARRSMRSENMLLHSLTGQSGKRNLDIMWDEQDFESVDRTMRKATEFVYHSNAYVNAKTKEPLAFQYDKEDMYSGEYETGAIIPAPYLEPFFNMYDSYEATIPLVMGKTVKEMEKMYRKKTDVE